MTSICLNSSRAWVRRGVSQAAGRAFRGGRLLDAAGLAHLLGSCSTFDAFVDTVADLNGHFAAIVLRDETAWLACDRMRTIPVYYTVGGRPAVGDDGEAVARAGGDTCIDPVSTEEFYLAGYVSGPHTRYRHLKQVRSGEAVEVTGAPGSLQVRPARYWHFHQRGDLPDDIPALLPEYGRAVHGAVRRAIEVADGRQIAIPLSGGYDSRSVLLTLAELGCRHIVGFTYGAGDTDEVAIGREIAGQMGIPWCHVAYSHGLWHECVRTTEWRQFVEHAGTTATVPHLQDWPALRHVTSSGFVHRDALVIPGYSGEVRTTASDEAPGRPNHSATLLARRLIARHYILWPWGPAQRAVRPDIERRVLESIGQWDTYGTLLSAEEAFDLNERQAKFIVNAVRSLEFWGLDWWLPLVDSEFLAFWERAPHAARASRALLRAYTDDLTRRLLPNPERVVGAGRHPLPPAAVRKSRSVARAVYRALGPVPGLRQLRRARRARLARLMYGAHPLRWYGVVGEERFVSALQSGAANINSLLTAQVLGRLDIA